MDKLQQRVAEYLDSEEQDRPKTVYLIYDLWIEIGRLRSMLGTLGVEYLVKESENASTQE